MNDFHILSLCIQNYDIKGAMLVLRDKSEFVARKILERIKVKLPVNTGRQFWRWLQSWLMNECRNEKNFNESDSSPSFATAESNMSGQSESGSSGRSQNSGASVHAGRSHQHIVSGETRTPAVCAWQDGLPPLHAYLGDERIQQSRSSAATRKPSVGLGVSDSVTNIPVLGDAENVCACEYSDGKIQAAGGGVDAPLVQQHIISVMEGGREAFERRREVYGSWLSKT